MQGQLLRVRIDAVHTPSVSRHSIDIALPTTAAIATLIPEIVELFGLHTADYPLASWRLRTVGGSDLDPEDTLLSAQVSPGAHLILSDDPGNPAPPRHFDAADRIASHSDGVGVIDTPLGCLSALAATLTFIWGLQSLIITDYLLAAALGFLALLALAGGLRIAVHRDASAGVLTTLVVQIFLCATTTAMCFVATSPQQALTSPPLLSALAALYFTLGLGHLLIGHHSTGRRVLATAGSLFIALALGAATLAAGLTVLGQPLPAAALLIVVAVLTMLLSPNLAVTIAGIRVPKIPAAGEPFDQGPEPITPPTATATAGWLLDGFLTGGAIALATGTLISITAETTTNWWAIGLAAAVIAFTLVHSRGHARYTPAAASAAAAVILTLVIAGQQWLAGNWILSATLVGPLLAATGLAAVPSGRISPSARRLAEIFEAVAIALVFPLAAILMELPQRMGALLS